MPPYDLVFQQTAVAIQDAEDGGELGRTPCVGETGIFGVAVELVFDEVSFDIRCRSRILIVSEAGRQR